MPETRRPIEPVPGPPPGEVEERTFVIERPRPVAEPYADFEERTIVVGGESADSGEPDEFDRTVVVGRADPGADSGADAEADEFDRTVIVGRAGADGGASDDGERTVVVGAAAPSEDATVQTGKSRAPRGTRRRRALTPAPLDPATLRPSVPGRGAGAVEAYPARAMPTQIAPIPVVMDETPPTRDIGAKPSVARRARRDAIAGLVAVAASVVVSVGGLIALALVVPSL